MSNISELARLYAPWAIVGGLALYTVGLVAQVRRSQTEEQKRQTSTATGCVVGFLDGEGRVLSEPIIYPLSASSAGMIVLYEFQPDAHAHLVRGQYLATQDELAALKMRASVNVRFNPKLPANSRIVDVGGQRNAALAHRPIRDSLDTEGTAAGIGWAALTLLLALVAAVFANQHFVPSREAAYAAQALALVCALIVLLEFRRLPLRMPETATSRLVRRWLLPPVMALGTFVLIAPFWGNLLPAAYTWATGAPGRQDLTVAGHKYGVGPRRGPQCTKVLLKGIPEAMVGNDVLCGSRHELPDVASTIHVYGQMSPIGIIVSDVRW